MEKSCCYSQTSFLVPFRMAHPLSVPLQPHFHFVESLVNNIGAQGHFFYASHRMSKPRRILSSSSSGVLKPCSMLP